MSFWVVVVVVVVVALPRVMRNCTELKLGDPAAKDNQQWLSVALFLYWGVSDPFLAARRKLVVACGPSMEVGVLKKGIPTNDKHQVASCNILHHLMAPPDFVICVCISWEPENREKEIWRKKWCRTVLRNNPPRYCKTQEIPRDCFTKRAFFFQIVLKCFFLFSAFCGLSLSLYIYIYMYAWESIGCPPFRCFEVNSTATSGLIKRPPHFSEFFCGTGALVLVLKFVLFAGGLCPVVCVCVCVCPEFSVACAGVC